MAGSLANMDLVIPLTQSWLPLPEKDPRVEGWLLLGNPAPILTILACYVYIVKVIGPAMMKNSKAYELKPVILLYNALMVAANLSISSYVVYHAFWTGHYAVWFTSPDPSEHPTTLLLLNVSWYYLILRLSECIETVLFVLRKRFRQVSTLHVFHHVSVTFSVFLYVTYGGFALACFELTFNAFIHVVMYSYYFLSALGPELQKYLWWKKYLTTLQLVQFVIMIARNVMLCVWLNNRYSALPAFMLFQCFVFFLQFFHFYIQSYRQKRDEKLQKKAAAAAAATATAAAAIATSDDNNNNSSSSNNNNNGSNNNNNSNDNDGESESVRHCIGNGGPCNGVLNGHGSLRQLAHEGQKHKLS